MKKLSVLFISLICLAAVSPAQVPEDDEIIKINTTLVSIPVVVTDRQGRHVSGLRAEDFTVFQNGKKQEIGFFATEEEPLSVAVLLDTSRSAIDVIDKIKSAAIDFIALLHPEDQAMIVTFDSKVKVLNSFTSNRAELERAIRNVEIGDRFGTVMRDAVREVVDRRFAKVKGRKAIILLTDGKDFGSGENKTELLNSLEESDVLVYSVFYETSIGNQNAGINRGGNRGGRPGGILGGRRGGRMGNRRGGAREREEKMDNDAKEYLEKMAKLTSGRFYQKNVTDLRKTFELITDELRKQYRLGFYPDSEVQNEIREITVKVDRKNVSVRARETYRAGK